ncbi:MAG: hypothetical protein ABSB76_06415 [Streptosporangiaceae bacterium]
MSWRSATRSASERAFAVTTAISQLPSQGLVRGEQPSSCWTWRWTSRCVSW